jgi:SAM-dependent methyltransferase
MTGQALISRPRRIAAAYLTGHGIEIGALHSPTTVPRGVRVRYVDRMSAEDLRREYPGTEHEGFSRVDVVDEAQTLATFADGSEDFIIANHVIEHVEDPIEMIENAMRVLSADGVLLLSVPDKRYTFDVDRPITTLQHLVDDHADGGMASRSDHYREWAGSIDKSAPEAIEAHAAELMRVNSNIHFHVWTARAVLDLMLYLGDVVGFEVVFVAPGPGESVLVLRKCGR